MNFEMFQGDTKTLAISVVDAEGTAVDLTGAQSIRWWAARKVTSAPAIEKSIGDGLAITNAVEGLLEVLLDPADTIGLRGEYYIEMELIDSTGWVATVLDGSMTVKRALIPPVA